MTARGLAIELSEMVALGLLLAALGPFGTGAMTVPWRVADWLVFMLGGYLFFRPVVGAGRLLARHGAVPMVPAIALACGLAAFPSTLLVAWTMAGPGWRGVTAADLAWLYPQVLLIGAIATSVQFALQERRRPAATDSSGPEPAVGPLPGLPVAIPLAAPAPAAFLDRLPASLGRGLLCLQNEDHYVRAHTDLGSVLILMRLRDAVAELGGIEGARTHRSWWVARDAVGAVVRRDRTVGLRLRNGLEVPVARTMVAQLRAEGWLS